MFCNCGKYKNKVNSEFKRIKLKLQKSVLRIFKFLTGNTRDVFISTNNTEKPKKTRQMPDINFKAIKEWVFFH